MTSPKVVPVAVASAPEGTGASPLGSARFVVTQLTADLEAAISHLDTRVTQARAEVSDLRERLEGAEVVRRHVLAYLRRLEPAEVDDAFQRSAVLQGALAVAQERIGELHARRGQVVEELASLRAASERLDQVEGSLAAPAETNTDGAARFRSASRQVFQIIEEERMRIARDLHDGPAQRMANLVLQAEVLERLAGRDPDQLSRELSDFKDGVHRALEETRRLIFDLRPMSLDDLGLVPTLRRLVREVEDKNGINARLHVVGEERRLRGNYEATIFRIVQEAVNNAVRHARAESIEVVLTMQPRRISALVRDDGEGFDVVATEARQGRTRNLGLISMRERADLEQGELELRSEVGRGTEVRLTFQA